MDWRLQKDNYGLEAAIKRISVRMIMGWRTPKGGLWVRDSQKKDYGVEVAKG